MKYYVVADVHGYFDELQAALTEQGYFADSEPHKLVVCGDLFDRGKQAKELQTFVLDLLEKDEVILIRGNHEDLAVELLHDWPQGGYLRSYHHSNGTVGTVCQLTGLSVAELLSNPEAAGREFLHTPYMQTLIPAMQDYYETPHYIFVHGWIPCALTRLGRHEVQYASFDNWRAATPEAWEAARWLNGMEAAHGGVTEPGKTIVCGHWHCSFGHAHYEGRGGEFDNDPDFTPYYGDGIIALDACTPISGRVNCIVVRD